MQCLHEMTGYVVYDSCRNQLTTYDIEYYSNTVMDAIIIIINYIIIIIIINFDSSIKRIGNIGMHGDRYHCTNGYWLIPITRCGLPVAVHLNH